MWELKKTKGSDNLKMMNDEEINMLSSSADASCTPAESCGSLYFILFKLYSYRQTHWVTRTYPASWFSLFTIIPSWPLTFNLLILSCRVWDGVCFSEPYTAWPSGWGQTLYNCWTKKDWKWPLTFPSLLKCLQLFCLLKTKIWWNLFIFVDFMLNVNNCTKCQISLILCE